MENWIGQFAVALMLAAIPGVAMSADTKPPETMISPSNVQSDQLEPLQLDSTGRFLVICHEGKRVGNGTAVMETHDGKNMLVATCKWVK